MKLPVLSAIKLVKALHKLGYEIDHQTGSHLILRQSRHPFRRVTVPNHKVIAKGTLRAILSQANISLQELYSLLG